MSTRAMKFLRQKRVSFEVTEYDHEQKGAVFASQAVGFPLERTVKTLVLDLGNNKYTMALMPGDKQLDIKRFAKVCSVKRVAMADNAAAERLTGYLVGGISPFGTKQKFPVVMEKSLLEFDKVAINGGQRGVLLIIAPEDIKKTLNCNVSAIAQD
ncbi:MAG: aminoacyl-tRNA deacylase [Desulfobacterales bacterium]|nr:aminoacyl-tRNA deacylase [Desulfobacterales bacterium]